MQLVIDAIEKIVPLEAALFCTEYNPIINFWVQRQNPTPYNFFTYPTFNTRAQADEVIEILRNRSDIYVLLFVPFAEGDHLGEWVSQNYEVVWRFPWALLMTKKM